MSAAGSAELFDSLAAHYDQHFAEPHRRAYDDLAWELVSARLPGQAATVIDVGCGTGRWARRLLDLGHRVIGIEPAPAMAARALPLTGTGRFTLLRQPMQRAELAPATADLTIAMGSLQYAPDPAAALARLASWTRPGGLVCVLVDSLIALVVELGRRGETETALRRLADRRGEWVVGERRAELALFDAAALAVAFEDAGLSVEHRAGLLVGATVLGRAELTTELERNYAGRLAVERQLSERPELADLGKQLLLIGRSGANPPHWQPARPAPR